MIILNKIIKKIKNTKKIFITYYERLLYLPVRPVNELVVVTGADHFHFARIIQFLNSYFRFENNRIIVYDLGFTDHEREQLTKLFPSIELRVFDFLKYPSYFNIKIAAGEYAWKPAIIHDVFYEVKGCICWMDAGNIIVDKLSDIRRIISKTGFFSPWSRGKITRWTHKGTLDFLKCENKFLNKRNLAAGCVALNYDFPQVRLLINRWKACALEKTCIAPEGSNRMNHRQDQAVLTVLAYQLHLAQKSPKMNHGFLFHKDIDHK